ncbi:MAG: glycosyltransferase XagB [Alphaproteobacteria bacterium]|nr:glycosyltransferase XagB [Alphaproteobacteria bacterium]
MQGAGINAAVLGRSKENPWPAVAADALSIVPATPDDDDSGPQSRPENANCPELDCIRNWLPEGVLAAAERRSAELSIGADRVLLASRLIAEDDYVQALAASLNVVFDPLADTPRSDCPLTDDRLIDAVAAGLLPLQWGDDFVFVLAPRGVAARRMTSLAASGIDLSRRFRFTSAERLQQFVAGHGDEALGRRAADGLRLARPDLSAAPRARRPIAAPLISVAALAVGLFAAAAPVIATINATLAAIFLAWSALRMFGGLVKHRKPNCRINLADSELPVYTIIAALYREAASVENLVASLRQLDYPPEKLDIKLVIEPDDAETRAAITRLRLGPPFEILTAPNAGPRTKPKALNAALPFARGSFTVIYDAEDRPERHQLRHALDMFLDDAALACVQARLTIDNTADSWLSRIFTAEYAGQFDVFLPGLAALRLPLPLGGSSNHFRTAVLREVGGWDPYNVTEDADLGMRLSRCSYGSAVIASTTYEEAPARFIPWLRQRTRWFKGWTKTWLVHMRAPHRLLRDLGLSGFLTFQLVVGGNVLAALIYPIFLAGLLCELAAPGPDDPEASIAIPVGLHAATLVAGFLASAFVSWRGLSQRGLQSSAWVLALMPLHWLLLSLAAWRALYQLLRDPYCWEKTEHGLAHTSRRRVALEGMMGKVPRNESRLWQPRASPAA